MKELDLSGVRMVQENFSQIKNEQAMKEAYYKNSIQDGTKRQEINGKLYVDLKVISLIAAGIAGFLIISKAVVIGQEISHYNNILEQKMELELTDDQIKAYQKDQAESNFFSNNIEKYQQIQEGYASLDNNNYNILGDNISNPNGEYLPSNSSDTYGITEKQQDAIDIATNEVIEEYQRRAK